MGSILRLSFGSKKEHREFIFAVFTEAQADMLIRLFGNLLHVLCIAFDVRNQCLQPLTDTFLCIQAWPFTAHPVYSLAQLNHFATFVYWNDGYWSVRITPDIKWQTAFVLATKLNSFKEVDPFVSMVVIDPHFFPILHSILTWIKNAQWGRKMNNRCVLVIEFRLV